MPRAHLKLRAQVCLDDVNSKGNARDPACVMRNRIAAYLYSKEATKKPIPPVSPSSVSAIALLFLLASILHSASSLLNTLDQQLVVRLNPCESLQGILLDGSLPFRRKCAAELCGGPAAGLYCIMLGRSARTAPCEGCQHWLPCMVLGVPGLSGHVSCRTSCLWTHSTTASTAGRPWSITRASSVTSC